MTLNRIRTDSKITVVITLSLILILGIYSRMQYHHHDCLGRICLVSHTEGRSGNIPEGNNGKTQDHHEGSHNHHEEEGHGHHIHPCPDGHEYISSQSSDNAPLPAISDILSLFISELPPLRSFIRVEFLREATVPPVIFLSPIGRKAPPFSFCK